jgi:hypothetical protein
VNSNLEHGIPLPTNLVAHCRLTPPFVLRWIKICGDAECGGAAIGKRGCMAHVLSVRIWSLRFESERTRHREETHSKNLRVLPEIDMRAFQRWLSSLSAYLIDFVRGRS